MKTVEVDIDDDLVVCMMEGREDMRLDMNTINKAVEMEFDRLVAEGAIWAARAMSLGMVILTSSDEQIRVKEKI